MGSHTFGFERWEQWLGEKARALREAGYTAELRSGGPPTPKPCCSFRLTTAQSLGQFDVWVTGEADFDVMDATSKEFAHHVWGMNLTDLSFESAFDDFLARVVHHPAPGRSIPASIRSAWFSEQTKLSP